MDNNLPAMTQYDVFLSYSHRNAKTVRRVQRYLETYRLPAKKRLKVFRDETDLPAGLLSERIKNALDSSASLIVCCSPEACASQHVPIEIDHFLGKDGTRPVVALLLKADKTSAIPPALREPEHLYSDLRNAWLCGLLRNKGRIALARAIAAITHRDLRTFVRWDLWRRIKKSAILGVSYFLILIVVLSIGLDLRDRQEARDLFDRFAVQNSGEEELSAGELDALWKLARSRYGVRRAFIKETVKSRENAQRFLDHAERLRIAILGLGIERRERLFRAVKAWYEAPPSDPVVLQAYIQWLSGIDREGNQLAEFLIRQIEVRNEPSQLEILASHLANVARRTSSAQLGKLATRLIRRIEVKQDLKALEPLAAAIASLGEAVSKDILAEVATQIVSEMPTLPKGKRRRGLWSTEPSGPGWEADKLLDEVAYRARAVGALGSRLPPESRRLALERFNTVYLDSDLEDFERSQLSSGLVALGGTPSTALGLEPAPEEVAEWVRQYLSSYRTEASEHQMTAGMIGSAEELSKLIERFAGSMSAEEVDHIATAILGALAESRLWEQTELLRVLASVGKHIDMKRADHVAKRLLGVMHTPPNLAVEQFGDLLSFIALSLADMAPLLSKRVISDATAALVNAIVSGPPYLPPWLQTPSDGAWDAILVGLGRPLRRLCQFLAPEDAHTFAQRLISELDKAPSTFLQAAAGLAPLLENERTVDRFREVAYERLISSPAPPCDAILAFARSEDQLADSIEAMKWPTCVGTVRQQLRTELMQRIGSSSEPGRPDSPTEWTFLNLLDKWGASRNLNLERPPRREGSGR